MRFRAPANVQFRRAQIILMLATLVPTVLMTALGIVLLAVGSSSWGLVTAGVLVLTFCTTSITGYILGSMFVSRGASLARVQSDFLSSVSHELRTPLTSIRMFIETLQNDRLTDTGDKNKCLALLDQEVERLGGLVERLIELSRMETGKHNFSHERVSINEVAEDALAAFDAAILPERFTVAVDLEPDLFVTGDRATLGQALVNLLTNAWKYTPPENKEIALSAHRYGKKSIEILVTDNGIGIPRKEHRHIFETFERGKSAIENRTRGVGLGLTTVRAIIRAHRGRVELRSKLGHGSEFRILLRQRRGRATDTVTDTAPEPSSKVARAASEASRDRKAS